MAKKQAETIEAIETTQEEVVATKVMTRDYYFTSHVNFSGKQYAAGSKHPLTTNEAISFRKYIIDKKDHECIPCKTQK